MYILLIQVLNRVLFKEYYIVTNGKKLKCFLKSTSSGSGCRDLRSPKQLYTRFQV